MNKYEKYLNRRSSKKRKRALSDITFERGYIYYCTDIEALDEAMRAAGFRWLYGYPHWPDYIDEDRAIRIDESGALFHGGIDWYRREMPDTPLHIIEE